VLEDIRWWSTSELTARVPGSLPPGTHALWVHAPNGTAELANAFVVLPTSAKFPYPPSNFDPLPIAPVGNGALQGCNAVFNTTSETFVVGCPGLQAAVSRVTLLDGSAATVLAFNDLDIAADASLRFEGERPAVIAVFRNALIEGAVLANSTAGVSSGAGSNGPHCAARAGGDGIAYQSGAGGAGYATVGGAGGAGNGAAGGAGGTQDPSRSPSPLRAGCPGGFTGLDNNVARGAGGGALQISAASELRISGVVSASGAGGLGGPTNDSGGFGGGSGGTLVLEGDTVFIASTARLTANGGGGGGGAGDGNTRRGGRGEDGKAASAVQALGGAPGVAGAGSGGQGGAGTTAPTNGELSPFAGGGGGGGAAGAIFVRASPGQCTAGPLVMSPAATFTNCP
jgi:hypothetical protein